MIRKYRKYNLFCTQSEITSRSVISQLREEDVKMYLLLVEVFSINSYVKSTFFDSMSVGDDKYKLFVSRVSGFLKIRFEIYMEV